MCVCVSIIPMVISPFRMACLGHTNNLALYSRLASTPLHVQGRPRAAFLLLTPLLLTSFPSLEEGMVLLGQQQRTVKARGRPSRGCLPRVVLLCASLVLAATFSFTFSVLRGVAAFQQPHLVSRQQQWRRRAPSTWYYASSAETVTTTTMSAPQQQQRPQDEPLVSVTIDKAVTHTMLPGSLTTYGRLLNNKNGQAVKFIAPNEDVSFHVLAGRTADQEPVLAFAGPAAAVAKQGSQIQVPASVVLPRPASLSLDEATLLPYYAASLLPPLMRAGIHGGEGSSGPASSKVCIVTGCGTPAIFAIQVLRAWGCAVVGVSRRNMDVLRKAGAQEVVDFSTTSFSEQVSEFAAVIDTVGTDVDAVAANLQKFKGAVYVSTMPSATRRMQSQGLLQGASLFTSVFFGKPDVAATNVHWVPEKAGAEAIEYVLKLAEAKHLTVPLVAPSWDDYWDSVIWPKDAETGARFGFPAEVVE